ncbi:hypothetical protein ASPACDRAFT_78608 [Aspergillus aculeatus ATCC 16872]|uniref:Uncharacterized protein n=1 Tax=Aspergillus aculeatus (strain ATCC 16872 / CBS 172.66 / WB 5094) TaxID=690307 RepID=A0A1L9WU70_ASPA1|nr:uncharacterized protein ASPACDRAFT_78608 [Aspergillus aculeatus ATCC 16872]OJJ99673.1 hypothetical protein ASPACDRAFT_78608 [Aspergillus aculeatus ATCC 16872]
MSDDEDYYDEYDEDIFWVEEPDPTIADDLAATSTNDAIFYDHPALEVEDYFSDWDDLSDDYYDEDPTAVRRARALGLLPAGDGHHDKQHSHHHRAAAVTKHQRKPKPTAKRTPFFDLGAFQSVVWKSPHQEKEQQSVVALHEPGEGEKVALLKNWREVFRSANPRMTAAVGVVAGAGAGRKPAPIQQQQQQQQQGLCSRGSSAGAEGRGNAESREVDGVDAATMEEVGDDTGKGVGKGGVVNGEGFVAAGLVIDGGEVENGGSFEGGGEADADSAAATATNRETVNGETADGSSFDESLEKPTAPRSRKRKADDAVDDIPETAAKTRAKRVASSTKAGKVNSSKDVPVPRGINKGTQSIANERYDVMTFLIFVQFIQIC